MLLHSGRVCVQGFTGEEVSLAWHTLVQQKVHSALAWLSALQATPPSATQMVEGPVAREVGQCWQYALTAAAESPHRGAAARERKQEVFVEKWRLPGGALAGQH